MKQRFVVVSDVHSHYTQLKNALNEVNFNSENDILISVGDLLDRGNETIETIKFILSLPKCVLVKGNHDILMKDLLDRGYSCYHDKSNGTEKSYYQILNYYCDKLGYNKDPNDIVREVLKPLWNKMVNYCELKNHIFVHSWIPTRKEGKPHPADKWITLTKDLWMEDWRNANDVEWDDAMWGNPFYKAQDGLNKTDKTIVFGHWHCSTGHSLDSKGKLSEFGEDAIWEPYFNEKQKILGIDACTAYTGEVNAVIIEDEFDENWFKIYGDKV